MAVAKLLGAPLVGSLNKVVAVGIKLPTSGATDHFITATTYFDVQFLQILSFSCIQLWILLALKMCLETQKCSFLFEIMLCALVHSGNDVTNRKQQSCCHANHLFIPLSNCSFLIYKQVATVVICWLSEH